ncbi:MAG: Eukaryotic translation initiation factor eIF-1 [Pleopsidium flavum]|nr:MAG: Eukaryotic translation initiation factor eIF-1 [Pleopsidium flavum]
MFTFADPFAEADEDTGETKQSQNYIHIRIQQRNGRKTLTTVQGLPKKFDQKKILKVIKKKFACNGTIVNDTEMGEVIQLQGDQRKDVQEFLVDKKEGLELDAKTIKVEAPFIKLPQPNLTISYLGPRVLSLITSHAPPSSLAQRTDRSSHRQALLSYFLPPGLGNGWVEFYDL